MSAFHIILPSNSPVADNRANSFTVHLPNRLKFNSSWEVGLAVMVYPQSWPTLGTLQPQRIVVNWKSGRQSYLELPRTRPYNVKELEQILLEHIENHKNWQLKELGAGITVQQEQTRQQNEAQEIEKQLVKEHQATYKRPIVKIPLKRVRRSIDSSSPSPSPPHTPHASVLEEEMESRANEMSDAIEQWTQKHQELADQPEPQQQEQPPHETLESIATELRPIEVEESQASPSPPPTIEEHFDNPPSPQPRVAAFAQTREKPSPLMLDGKKMDAWRWTTEGYNKVHEHVKIIHSAKEQRFVIYFNQDYIESVVLTSQLAYMLGFAHHTLRDRESRAENLPDILGGINCLYVYAPDLIEPVLIGDIMAPVLRIINVHSAKDDSVEECYVAMQYHRLLRKDIGDIHIDIRTEWGEFVPFSYGMCRLTLQFKKKYYL